MANDGKKDTKAAHGPRNEVSWEGGSGRQPYANQGETESEAAVPGAEEVAEGNRGELSGRNREQLDEARRKP
jgi:hypothetical protein